MPTCAHTPNKPHPASTPAGACAPTGVPVISEYGAPYRSMNNLSAATFVAKHEKSVQEYGPAFTSSILYDGQHRPRYSLTCGYYR